jgi:hypothetical protein
VTAAATKPAVLDARVARVDGGVAAALDAVSRGLGIEVRELHRTHVALGQAKFCAACARTLSDSFAHPVCVIAAMAATSASARAG